MISTINDLYKLVEKQTVKKKLALAAADDHHALDAVYNAQKKGIIEAILVGDAKNIAAIAEKYGYDLTGFQIIDIVDKNKAVEEAVKLVSLNKADILMKGNISTSGLLKGVLNKEWGLRSGNLLSHIAIFEVAKYHKLIALTDVAMNIAPDLSAKVSIINNSVEYLNKIGITNPKVALIAAVETVSTDMPATVDAAVISKMNQRGQIKNCIIDGPFAIDNAVNKESAIHKGIVSDVAGDADLLVFPDIEAGNVGYKVLSFLTDSKLAALVLGAKAPIVLTSRSDSEEAKLNSIVLAAVC